jgi:hypothetical protein
MPEPETQPEEVPAADGIAALRARAEALERQLGELQRDARHRLIQAELKAEALRAGIIDLDGLKLADLSGVTLTPEGEVVGGGAVIAALKRSKPWMFASASTSAAAKPPAAQPPRQKLATEMTDEEYRVARAAILKRRG